MLTEQESVSVALQRMLEKEMGSRRRFGVLGRLFRRREGSSEASRAGRRSSDLTVAALGVTLGLICALFPWYIFFNQEKFGIRAMKFSGSGDAAGRLTLTQQPQRIGAPMQVDDIPAMELDLFATATLPDQGEARKLELPGMEEQPFPVDDPVYKVVHVINGRAMIEDDTGLWVVQRGSKLPDNSVVAAIEKREDR